ncbi:GNAT family N-acetyltransferase [Sedimentitalea sp. HM32M-2]|uniref:GNAT family N-acetyltransferase n=1 Tax=Sedimentitalea sp. HM32M-2 TaxID=3351566 RepID=UPI003632F745
MTPIIRRARVSDAADLARCIEAAYAAARDSGVSLPPVAQGVEEDIRQHLVWVAVDGPICGGIVLSVTGEAAHMINIAVEPRCAGCGVGRRLIETALAEARQRNAVRIDLATHVDMPENVSLYRHLGWRETGRTDRKVTMSRRLD